MQQDTRGVDHRSDPSQRKLVSRSGELFRVETLGRDPRLVEKPRRPRPPPRGVAPTPPNRSGVGQLRGGDVDPHPTFYQYIPNSAKKRRSRQVSDLPASASVVVIGAGIVGNSVVGHLAELGWQNIVQIDKGPLPNPGGSTGHASNFIFPVDHNKEMAMLTIDSQRQYEAMGVNVTCGGIEVARTPERMEELRRRMSSAKNWDMEAHLVSPAEIKELVPFINEEILLGGGYYPTVSAVDSLRAGTIFREKAQARARSRPSPTPRCSISRPNEAGSERSSPTGAGSTPTMS